MTGNASLAAAREAITRRDWPAAIACYAVLGPADLTAADWDRVAEAAWWCGEYERSFHAYEQAHLCYLAEGNVRAAALAAMLRGGHAVERGDAAIGSAWMNRARRLLGEAETGVEHGYAAYFDVVGLLDAGDIAQAAHDAAGMLQLGRDLADPTLQTLGLLCRGRTLLKEGHFEDGMAMLDEAMLGALSDELHPFWSGAIYCNLMDACSELMDMRRAGEWTEIAERWCAAFPEAVVYRGICQVHRARVLLEWGQWDESEHAARAAGSAIRSLHLGVAAAAEYHVGELCRLRGDLAGAGESYRRAIEIGHGAQPGLARARMAHGQSGVALAMLRSALLAHKGDLGERAQLLEAMVEVACAAGEIESARAAAAELQESAQTFNTPGHRAIALRARGAVALAEDDAVRAVNLLRDACEGWQLAGAHYQRAVTRMLYARALGALGDGETAALERSTAESVLHAAGADPVMAWFVGPAAPAPSGHGLTAREAEILRMVAAGHTNREIAGALVLSDKTVGRHLSNIFNKLGVSTRAAATAYAYEQGIVERG